jgi:hypothetical protein
MIRKLDLFQFSGEMAGKLRIKCVRHRKTFSSSGPVPDTTKQGPTPVISPEGGKETNFRNAVFLFDYEIMDEDQTVSNPNKIHENSSQNSLQMAPFLIF